jgi:hypothetical protein
MLLADNLPAIVDILGVEQHSTAIVRQQRVHIDHRPVVVQESVIALTGECERSNHIALIVDA